MTDLESISCLLGARCFVEVAYFGTVSALKSPSARAHLLAGIGCCGCVATLAAAQRALEGEADPCSGRAGEMAVSAGSELPYDGLFHLIEALRIDPSISAAGALREVLDSVADDLAFVARREIHRPPERRRRHSHRMACVAAALLLRRLAGNDRALPGIASPSLEAAEVVIASELQQRGGDASFF